MSECEYKQKNQQKSFRLQGSLGHGRCGLYLFYFFCISIYMLKSANKGHLSEILGGGIQILKNAKKKFNL